MISPENLVIYTNNIANIANDVLHFFLYIINPKNYCTFKLHGLCVRARTMHGLEIDDVLVVMNFGFIFIYVHFLEAICYIEAIKPCLLPFLSNLYCSSVKRPTSIKRSLFKVPRVAAQ